MKNDKLFRTFHHILDDALSNVQRAALVTADGESIFIKSETLADIATLPSSASTCLQYLQLRDGDVGICNDPYSGGGILSSFTLVTGLNFKAQSKPGPADFLLATKLTLKPRITNSLKLDDEGLRIPPTPIVVGGELNKDIFNAMGGHPKFPPELRELMPLAIKELLRLKDEVKKRMSHARIEFGKPEVKLFLKASNDQIKKVMHELSEGESRVEFEIGPGEKLKLRTEVHENKVIFDFSGSDAGKTHFLTFPATFGACVGALFAFTRKALPINSGTTSIVEVVAQRGTIVNANFPKPVALGLTDGLDIIANLVISGLSALDKARSMAPSGTTHCAFEMRFKDGSRFYDRVHPGGGAMKGADGLSGHSLWWRARLSTSIEEIERRYPVAVESTSFRTNSGGAGHNSGGDGVAKSFRLLEPAELVWSFTDSTDKATGFSGGKSGLGPEVIVQKKSGSKVKLTPFGQMKLEVGDRLSVLAPGGGGFGEPKS